MYFFSVCRDYITGKRPSLRDRLKRKKEMSQVKMQLQMAEGGVRDEILRERRARMEKREELKKGENNTKDKNNKNIKNNKKKK